MRQTVIIIAISLFGTCLLWLFQASLHSYAYTQIGIGLINKIGEPYQQHGTGKRIVIYGDSAAFGTGATRPETTFAGVVGKNCPKCSVKNLGQNGFKTKSLLEQLQNSHDQKQFDRTYILIGANDIMHFYVDLHKSCKNMRSILKISSQKSAKVILLTAPDASYADFFAFPLNYYYGTRSKKFNGCSKQAARRFKNTSYIDLEGSYTRSLFAKHQASDGLHMNDTGNRYWYKLTVQNNQGR